MLSRQAFRAATRAWRCQAPITMSVVPQRNYRDHTRSLDERLKLFKEVTDTYFNHPDRDHKNFPYEESKADIKPLPTRMLILPDSWFANLYQKMGVSGPYILSVGGLLTLFGKEWILIDHTMAELFACSYVIYFLSYKMRSLGAFSLRETDDPDYDWGTPKAKATKEYADAIQYLEKAIWQEEGQRYLYEAKREGVDLQLEATYRQRMVEARSEIKKRLDYQLAKETSLKNFEHNYMTRWIIDNVVKGITVDQEKAAITQCLGDLKAIAARQ